MFKERKQKLVVLLALVLALGLVLGKTPAFAATNVGSFDELKAAVDKGGEITLTKDIDVTETLVINKDVKISGEGHKLTLPDGFIQDQMFKVDGKQKFTLEKITLDGKEQGRLIYSEGGTITLTNATLRNGCPGASAKANPGGGVFLKGGSLTATNIHFKNNTPGTTQGLGEGDRDVNGGAIYSGSDSSKISITGGSFTDNKVEAYGHGAAIYQENGTLTVDGTSFKNNKGHVEGGNAGTQGACIHTRDKVTAIISNVEAEIAKGFNTGGFLRSWGSDVTVTGSTFIIKDLGDGYGYSGGALCFENGTSKVEKSKFTCTGSKLYHAGGFIDIVGGGTHVIDTNTMTGGGKENGQQIASFGGAISVEQGASAEVTIKDNTIKDSSASDNGGAIAIGTRKGEKTPSTVTMSGNKISNAGTLFWGAQHGGGIFIGPDAKVTMSNDTLSDTRSSYGGGIYNEGDLTITGGSSLTGGVGSKLGGEIYNNGALTVDNATITGNFVGGAAWQQYASHGKNFELGGTNIYAEKSVTVTPGANITNGKDVRVLDGQSKILLTGPLTKEIDVSISEIAGGNETQKRRVGYVVAEGKDGYSASKADANKLHYIGKTNAKEPSHYTNQPRAEFTDDTSTGTWDFVLDKGNGTVVLGQRVKLIYHGNLGKIGSKDSEEELVDVYKTPEFWEGKDQLKKFKTANPTRDKYSFMGWYYWKEDVSAAATNNEGSIQELKDPSSLSEKLFDFSRVTFQNNETDTDKIITPNVINTYAGWSENIDLDVAKEWKDAEDNDKKSISLTLYDGETSKETKTFDSSTDYGGKFENLPVFTKSYKGEEKNMNLRFAPKVYKIKEAAIDGFTTSYAPEAVTANSDDAKTIKITNTKEKTGNVFVKYVAEDGTVLEAESKVVENAKVGTEYTTEQKAFDGYEFSKMGENSAAANGKVVAGDLHVIYVYKAKTGNVFVKYIAEDGTVLEEESPVVENAKVGTEYTTEQKTFDGYEYSTMGEGSAKANGKVVAGDLHVIYVYKAKTGNVFVKYVAEDGTVLEAESKVVENAKVGTDYTTEQKTFDGYEYSKMGEGSAKASGKVVVGDLHVTYVYKKTEVTPKPETGNVFVKYIAEDGTVLEAESKVVDNAKVGTEYTTEQKTFDGYEYSTMGEGSAKASGNVVAGDLHVTYVYKKVEVTPQPKTGNVFVKYVTEDGKELEKESPVLENVKVGTAYTTEQKTFDGYEFSKMGEKSAAASGEVAAGDLHVIYVYKVKEQPPTSEIITKYVDGHDKDLIDPKKGDWPKECIPGYEYVETKRTKTQVTHIYKKVERRSRGGGGSAFWNTKPVPDDGLLNKEDHKAYMFGYPDSTFLPNRNMTREEVTAMFARLLKDYPKERRSYVIPYNDVTASDWSYEAIGFMTEKGIVKGYEDGSFKPTEAISRAEFAAMAARFDRLVDSRDNPFFDVPDSHWALASINSAAAKGWVSGYPDGSFKPERKITRSEVVSITNIMLDRFADKDFVRNHLGDMIEFTDLTEGNWAYFPIMEATNGHDYTRKATEKEEDWSRLNGEEFRFPLLYRK